MMNSNWINEKTWNLYEEWYALFYAIAGISLVNTLLFYLSINFWLSFWLWITEYLDFLAVTSTDINQQIIYFWISIIISCLFILIWYLTKKKVKYILVSGMFLYWIDTLYFLYYINIIWIIAHVVILKWLYEYHQAQK